MGLRDRLFGNNKGKQPQRSRSATRPSHAAQPHDHLDRHYNENDYYADMKDPLFPMYMTEVGLNNGMSFSEYKRIRIYEEYSQTNSRGQRKADISGHGDQRNAASPSMAGARPSVASGPSPPTRRPQAGTSHQPAAPAPPPAYADHLRDPQLNYIPRAEIQKAMNDEELQAKTARALKNYDIAFLVDDSSSMCGHWDQVKRLLGILTEEAVKHDKNGVDLHFMNHGSEYPNLKSAKAVAEVMSKVTIQGNTPMAEALDKILDDYVPKLYIKGCAEVKCLDLIVITDGEPNDAALVKEVISVYARYLDTMSAPMKQVGIQFIQVGNSSYARQFLVSLDNDNYAGRNARRDLVDTLYLPELSTVDKATMFKALVGGIDRLIDRNDAWSIGVNQAYDRREGLIDGMSDAYMHVVPTSEGLGTMYSMRNQQPPGYDGGMQAPPQHQQHHHHHHQHHHHDGYHDSYGHWHFY